LLAVQGRLDDRLSDRRECGRALGVILAVRSTEDTEHDGFVDVTRLEGNHDLAIDLFRGYRHCRTSEYDPARRVKGMPDERLTIVIETCQRSDDDLSG